MNDLSILIVDDHNLVCNGIKFILEECRDECGYGIIDTAYSGERALELISTQHFDIVLCDIKMPVMSGSELTRQIIAKFPDQNIIAISMHGDIANVKDMLNAGAKGYLVKDCGVEILNRAIKTVHSGERYFCNEVAQILLSANSSEDGLKESSAKTILTRREREILEMIFHELTNDQIGIKLGLSKRTVDTHRQNILKKLGVKNTAGLIRYAIEQGVGSDSQERDLSKLN